MNRCFRPPCYLSALTVLLLFTACVQPVRQKSPLRLEQAERHNILGINAETRQMFDLADTEFTESYRLYSGVENYQGMVTALVNSSRLNRQRGDNAKAENAMKLALEILPQTPALEAEVCFEMTKLALANGNHDGAVIWAGRGVDSASEIDRGRMLNVSALAFMQKVDYPKAKELAGAALKASRVVVDRREESNALRLLGDIAYAGKNYRESLEMYAAALPIDKELALSTRISDDLRGIARSFAASENLESAAEHYQRSAAINLAERDFKRGAEDLEMLLRIFERTDNSERFFETAELLEKIKHTSTHGERR